MHAKHNPRGTHSIDRKVDAVETAATIVPNECHSPNSLVAPALIVQISRPWRQRQIKDKENPPNKSQFSGDAIQRQRQRQKQSSQ